MRGVDAGGGQQLGGCARARQLGHAHVHQPELLDSGLKQRGSHGGAEAALGMMVLGDDEAPAGGIRGGGERVGVDGLDRVEVDHARVDPVKRELIGRTEAFVQGDARTDQRDGIRWAEA